MTQAPPFSEWPPVVVPGARRLPLTLAGRPFALSVAAPEAPAPSSGYPLIFLLDADGYFASAAEIAHRLAARGASTGVRPCLVAGLDSVPAGASRHRDFTAGPPASPEDTPDGAGEIGCAADFLSLLLEEALPAIERQFPVDPARRVLTGHSLSGYFSLLALGMAPRAFATYAALSPSLWWSADAVSALIDRADLSQTGVFLAVGADEEPPAPATARHDRRKMVSRLRDFAAYIEPRALRSELLVLAGENHGSMRFAALAQMLKFSLAR